MKTGKQLIAEIDSYPVGKGCITFWWLGQHSYVLKTARKIIYLDPYLSPAPSRLLQSPLKPEEITNADIVTGSHDHSDHIDHPVLPALMNASPKCKLLVPKAAAAALRKDNIDMARVCTLDDGGVYDSDGVRITAVKAAHEFFDYDEKAGYPYLGFIIETDGVAVYHSGDTCNYEGLAAALRQWDLTAAFLPINGRDAKRLRAGCIGNMTYQEAVDLAGTITVGAVIPGHYGMFAMNTADPALFADYLDAKYPERRSALPKFGEPVDISKTTD
ncbi:MAG: MBL fold metallo-hydrolase [Spirochaetes bacterium]|nr:MBL fold metallo-hydrolase [Spirochaetota bacterium]